MICIYNIVSKHFIYCTVNVQGCETSKKEIQKYEQGCSFLGFSLFSKLLRQSGRCLKLKRILVFFLGDLEGEAVCGGVWSHRAVFLLEKHQETGVSSGQEGVQRPGGALSGGPTTHERKQGRVVDAADLL